MSQFYETEDGAYRYFYDKGSKLRLQIKPELLQAFRSSSAGRQVEPLVDLLAQGSGWYEVTCAGSLRFRRFGTETDGLKSWVKALNKFYLGEINANPSTFEVRPVGKAIQLLPNVVPPSPDRLQALAAKFAKH